MKKIVIIGKGPAGISAALYAKRGGFDTTVIGMDAGSIARAEQIENYYGFAEPILGAKLSEEGVKGAVRLGVEVISDEVVSIGFEETLVVKTKTQTYPADALILATGSKRAVPRLKNFELFDGKGISYCAVCDGFFHRGNEVAVLGNGEYALSEALELSNIAKKVTLLTDSQPMQVSVPDTITVDNRKIASLEGEERLERILFEDGTSLPVSGLFIALGVAGSADFAKKLGAMTEGNRIVVNEKMQTNLPGLFAAGDCTGGLLQISKAVYEGAVAGMEAVKHLKGGH